MNARSARIHSLISYPLSAIRSLHGRRNAPGLSVYVRTITKNAARSV
jgi:hypothetical protein